MVLLTSGNRLSLSMVILLTLRDGLWSALRLVSTLARYPRSSLNLVWRKSCIRHVIKRPHAHDNGATKQANGHMKGWKSELCKGGTQNAIVCKFRFCSTEEVGKMYYSVGWLLKIMSTSRVIVLEAGQLWLPHLQKLPVCIVRKVVSRSHPMESQHTSRKTYILFR